MEARQEGCRLLARLAGLGLAKWMSQHRPLWEGVSRLLAGPPGELGREGLLLTLEVFRREGGGSLATSGDTSPAAVALKNVLVSLPAQVCWFLLIGGGGLPGKYLGAGLGCSLACNL